MLVDDSFDLIHLSPGYFDQKILIVTETNQLLRCEHSLASVSKIIDVFETTFEQMLRCLWANAEDIWKLLYRLHLRIGLKSVQLGEFASL